MDKIKHQEEHFEQVSERYFQARQAPNHIAYKKTLWDDVFKDLHLPDQKSISVLEPMCGYSEGKKIIEERLNVPVHYEGFDYSDTLISEARKRDPSVNIFKQDVTTFQTDKKYDVIILIGGLHHVPDFANDVLKNLRSCLADGGVFINFEPTYNLSFIKYVRDKIYEKNSLFDEQTERAFSLKELNGMYEQNRFQIVRQLYPGLVSYVLYYNPDAFPGLNLGSPQFVSALYKLETPLTHGFVGKRFSFATLSILSNRA